jgi:phosphate transport system substrate-binding protein
VGFGCLGTTVPGMKMIALAEHAAGPFYTGTLAEVKSMAYPLTRPVYMVIDREPGAALPSKIEEFLRYVLSQEGQTAIAAADGWLPLPPAVAAVELRKLQ